MKTVTVRLLTGVSMATLLVVAQKVPPGIGEGWMPEFDHACRQLLALAEATPAEKFGWRPAPGVRSVSEVYMHIAIGNYALLRNSRKTAPSAEDRDREFLGCLPPRNAAFALLSHAGLEIPDRVKAQLKEETEKSVAAKADVLKWLKDSQQLLRELYPKADRQRKLKFLGHDTNVDGVLLRILVHSHEHMGQSIAYARMIGVAPPWSQAQ